MPLIPKPNYNQIFASQAPEQDKPAVFNNYPEGWGPESRPNNGKPTIKGFNYLQQTSDLKDLWILQNGACLPYDESIEYAEGAPVLKDGVIQYKTASGFKSRDSVTIPTYNNAADGVDPATGVAEGAYFNVRSADDNMVLVEYRNVGGSAVATGKSYPSGSYVEAIAEYTALPFKQGESYVLHERVQLNNGDIVRSTIANNTNNPNTSMVGWVLGVGANEVRVGDGTLDLFAAEIESSADKIITPMNFGALGDGSGLLVSDFYPNITEARRKFPNLTSMSLTIDSAACNEWILSTKGAHYLGDKTKHYVLNTDINDSTTQNFLIKFPASRQVWANKAKISVLNDCPMFYGIFGNSDTTVNLTDSSVDGVIIDHNSQNREYVVVNNVLVKPNFDFCYLNGVDCEFTNNTILNAVQTNSVYANNYALNKRGKIKANTYINCGSDTIECDHSTFYTHGADFEIKDNKGVTTLGKKGVACFVEIHSTETRIQNNYCYGYGGFCNYTGISNVGVLENGIVSGNVFECVQFGVRVFSAKLLHNIGTHGIDGLEIQGNKGKIHQNLLGAGTQKMYIGYGVQAGSNLAVKNLFIKGNSIEYALDNTALDYDALACAVGINESGGTAIYENIEIGGNTIINAPIMAIGLGFGGGILKNTHVLPNTIINAAQGLHTSFSPYKSAINVAPNKIEGYLKIDEQSVTDTLAQTRLVNSVSVAPIVDSTSADIQIAVNTILQGDKASFVRSVANSGNKTLPLISVKLNKQPAFTGHNFKAGSKIKNTLNNSDYLNIDNTSVFKLSSSSEVFDPPNIVSGGTITRQISLFGARSGDFIIANFSVKNTDIQLSCDVLASDAVTVTFKNNSAVDINLASGVLTVRAL